MNGFALAQAIRQDPKFKDTRIILLTSGGNRGDAARCREIGIAAYLTKPTGDGELLGAILRVLAKKPEDQPEVITRHLLRESHRALKVLVVDDNPVNQRLAVRLLEKHGHSPQPATSGRAALELLAHTRFDLVLMDVQMPDIDGLEATATIRRGEQSTGLHIPIIAMTAHAMTGDRQRCLAAGMDAYVAKPVNVKDLFAAIESVVAGKSQE